MSTLCRVYRDDAAQVQPAPWRQTKTQQMKAPNGKPARASRPGGEAAAEVAEIRASVEQVSALAEQRTKEAWEQGVRAGEESARRDLEDQVRAAAEALSKALADIESTRSDVLRRAETDTVRLAVEIARRVLHRELSVDTGALTALTKAAIEKLRNQEIYRVRVHPDQEKLIRSCLDQAGRGTAIEVAGDPTQPKGGALFEFSRGTLDASVETQLREIEHGLADEMRRRA